ncbi:hypothetical protein C9374_007820 [Naegleria lovaniensis]|uniref:MYCBP-associated protein n=1 Tax=Naegleria lovaniensis TaxID=51637 RepID=A0AA88KFV6_NAELO|nr:uncharacterized protein C9374_007820 [Naegleria lovaniensis]KAG2378672.1 hypothetical protein C9374_007820 [Naegleria lovaniensis]
MSPPIQPPVSFPKAQLTAFDPSVIRFPQSEHEVLGSLDNYFNTLSKSGVASPIATDRSLASRESANVEAEKKQKKNRKHLDFNAIHEDKAIGRQFLQEKALRKYEDYLRTWNAIEDRICTKLEKPKKDLVMESHEKYRLKREEIDFLEASLPVETRHNEWSWELSLRKVPEDDGVRYVQIGWYPYPLFCPIIEPKVRRPTTVRNPNKIGVISENTSLGIRTLSSDYVKKMYGEILSKTFKHDPAPELEELQIQGKSITANYQTYDIEEEFSPNIYSTQDDDVIEEDTSNVPSFSLSENDILFDCTPNEQCKKEIILENTGCCALRYKWVNLEPVTDLQRIRAASKFLLTDEKSGILLPNTMKSFTFSFESDIEGIFTDGFRLETVPKAFTDCDRVLLKGVVISDTKEFDPLESQLVNNATEEYHNSNCVEISNSSSLRSTPSEKLPDHREEMRKIKSDLLREKFVERNKELLQEFRLSVISKDLLQAFYCLYMNAQTIVLNSQQSPSSMPNSTWDYSIFALRTLIQQVQDESTRHGLLSVMLQLLRVLEREQVENLEQETRNLETKIRQSIMYEQFVEAIDEFLDTASFLHDSMFNSTNTDPKKPSGSTTKEDSPETLKTYLKNLTHQTYTIFGNAISRVESLWKQHLENNSKLLTSSNEEQ